MITIARISPALLLVASVPTLSFAATLTWNGDDADWTVGSNWTPPGSPAADDMAVIDAGTAQLNSNATILGLTHGGGAIAGSGLLTLTGPSEWTAGTHHGPGTTHFESTLAVSGPDLKTISGTRTVDLDGITTWSGNTGNNNNAIRFWNGATVNNNGTFNDANEFDSFIEHNVGGPHNFNNAGTYNKTADTITTVDIGVAFNNSGTVNIDAGTFRPSGGSSTGTFDIAADAVLDFRNGNNILDDVTTSGAGTFSISSDNVGADAVVTVNGGSHTTALSLSGSTLAGSDHIFEGPVSWTGGAIAGAAATTFSNDVEISGPATKTLFGGRVLNLEETTTWSGNTGNNNNAIRFWNGATLNNNGTFNDANEFDSFIEHNVGGPHNFNNVGTYNKTADTVTTVDFGVVLNNIGTVNVEAGTLAVQTSFDNMGTIHTATGATFASTNPRANLVNHGVLEGTGNYDPAAGLTVLNLGEVQPGTATTTGTLTILGDYTQDEAGLAEFNLGGLTDFDAMAVAGNLSLDGLLHVSSVGGFNPNDGDSFTIIEFDDGVDDASDLAGVFSQLTWSGFAADVSFTALYFDHSVVLSASATPVPLPGALWLFGSALAAVAFAEGRKRADR